MLEKACKIIFFWVQVFVLISAVIIPHELGHYAVGKYFDTEIEEFSLGLGPKITSINVDGEQFSLRAIPLLGYVSFASDTTSSSDNPRLITNKTREQKIKITSAGILVNLGMSIIFLIIARLIITLQKIEIDRVSMLVFLEQGFLKKVGGLNFLSTYYTSGYIVTLLTVLSIFNFQLFEINLIPTLPIFDGTKIIEYTFGLELNTWAIVTVNIFAYYFASKINISSRINSFISKVLS